eukprot:CAMPEP_0178418252 /NCGR_PEP_ID=MMETSP0689_2-20121128/24992_1 /TAXON_ID=160604 /ORGANISM="Amphidinium massartii, Strain CS-259" /LENGTH=389 /DNA_ID=CAMNT_0020039639 /DNA_START=48 /DNA_END=1217 /DNA_ORIENTATION=+
MCAPSMAGPATLVVVMALTAVPVVVSQPPPPPPPPLHEACHVDAAERVACGRPDIGRSRCEDKGCCWYPEEGQTGAPSCFVSPTAGLQCEPDLPFRHACGDWQINQNQCAGVGCCWDESGSPSGFFEGRPQCYAKTQPSPVCSVEEGLRESCGFAGISWEQCLSMGCCMTAEPNPTCYQQGPATPDIKKIICPFLSTLVNQGILPVKSSYTREELQQITIEAGLDEETTIGHVEGNFMHNPSGEQDIFNMEGAANEHITSTGVHDCATFFYDCKEDSNGVGTCTNTTLECQLPNEGRFESFFSKADVDPADDYLTSKELSTFAEGYPDIIDGNPLRVGGSINGSHQAILAIFGEPKGEGITKANLKRIFIDRQFPDGYTFPAMPVIPAP